MPELTCSGSRPISLLRGPTQILAVGSERLPAGGPTPGSQVQVGRQPSFSAAVIQRMRLFFSLFFALQRSSCDRDGDHR